MQNRQIPNFKKIHISLSKIHDSYESLFDVPGDNQHTLVDLQMPANQVNDLILFSEAHHDQVRIQFNLKPAIVESTGYLRFNRAGRLLLTDPNSGVTQIINPDSIRSICQI